MLSFSDGKAAAATTVPFLFLPLPLLLLLPLPLPFCDRLVDETGRTEMWSSTAAGISSFADAEMAAAAAAAETRFGGGLCVFCKLVVLALV